MLSSQSHFTLFQFLLADDSIRNGFQVGDTARFRGAAMVGWGFFSWHAMNVMQSRSLALRYFLISNRVVTPLAAAAVLPVLVTTLSDLQNVIYDFKMF